MWDENALLYFLTSAWLGGKYEDVFMTLHLLSEAALLMSRIWQCPVESHR